MIIMVTCVMAKTQTTEQNIMTSTMLMVHGVKEKKKPIKTLKRKKPKKNLNYLNFVNKKKQHSRKSMKNNQEMDTISKNMVATKKHFLKDKKNKQKQLKKERIIKNEQSFPLMEI